MQKTTLQASSLVGPKPLTIYQQSSPNANHKATSSSSHQEPDNDALARFNSAYQANAKANQPDSKTIVDSPDKRETHDPHLHQSASANEHHPNQGISPPLAKVANDGSAPINKVLPGSPHHEVSKLVDLIQKHVEKIWILSPNTNPQSANPHGQQIRLALNSGLFTNTMAIIQRAQGQLQVQLATPQINTFNALRSGQTQLRESLQNRFSRDKVSVDISFTDNSAPKEIDLLGAESRGLIS